MTVIGAHCPLSNVRTKLADCFHALLVKHLTRAKENPVILAFRWLTTNVTIREFPSRRM